MLFESCIDECPEDEQTLFPVSELDIHPCIGCGACEKETERVVTNDDGEEVVLPYHACAFDDEMTGVRDQLEAADELTVVCPVYFSGVPSPMKALLDRLQPFYWSDARHGELRPLVLHIVGDGHDPYGYDALASEVASAGLVAGFQLERIFDWVGKIDEDGNILEEADEYLVGDIDEVDDGEEDALQEASEPVGDVRPKLDLSEGRLDSESEQRSANKGRLQGERSQKGKQRSDKSQGSKPHGDKSHGGKPQGNKSQSGKRQGSSKPHGGKPKGGGKSQGNNKPRSGKPQGGKSYDGMHHGGKSQGNRSNTASSNGKRSSSSGRKGSRRG